MQAPRRGSGRTLDMVKALPETGAVVVVPVSSMRGYVRQMILDVRGRQVLDRCKIAVIETEDQVIAAVRGDRRPAAVDHAFWDQAKPSVSEAMRLTLEAAV